jgi:hypothetical protein
VQPLWQFIAFDRGFADMPQQAWLLGIAGDALWVCELNHISEHLISTRQGGRDFKAFLTKLPLFNRLGCRENFCLSVTTHHAIAGWP